jgi:hypothetical protein
MAPRASWLSLPPFELDDLLCKTLLARPERLQFGSSVLGASRHAVSRATPPALPPHRQRAGERRDNYKADQECCAHRLPCPDLASG